MKKLSHLLEKYSNFTESVLDYNQLQTYLKHKGITDPRDARTVAEKIFAEGKVTRSTPGENSIEASDYYVKDVESALQKLNIKGSGERKLAPRQNNKVLEMQKNLNKIIPVFGRACQKAAGARLVKEEYKKKLKYVGEQYVQSDLKIKEDGVFGADTYKMLGRVDEAMKFAMKDLGDYPEEPRLAGFSSDFDVGALADCAERISKTLLLRLTMKGSKNIGNSCKIIADELSKEISYLESMHLLNDPPYPAMSATDIVLSSLHSKGVIKLANLINEKHLKKKF